jgi:hypothetical protein
MSEDPNPSCYQTLTRPSIELYTPLVDHFHVLCFSTMALQQAAAAAAAAAALGRVY